jgi:hypothetical protein
MHLLSVLSTCVVVRQFNSCNDPVKAKFAYCALAAAVTIEILFLRSYVLHEMVPLPESFKNRFLKYPTVMH